MPTAPLLFECDGGITSAQWAIAETGTLVLESKGERHRLVSLVPPVHIAVVEAGRIRADYGGECFATVQYQRRVESHRHFHHRAVAHIRY